MMSEYIRENYDCEVVCFTADVGQVSDASSYSVFNCVFFGHPYRLTSGGDYA